MADARPRDSAVGAELPRARAAPRGKDRLADAEPAEADRSLHRLLPGGAGGDAAQLPLHRNGDRPRARRERRTRAAGACRAGARPCREPVVGTAAAGEDRLPATEPPRNLPPTTERR